MPPLFYVPATKPGRPAELELASLVLRARSTPSGASEVCRMVCVSGVLGVKVAIKRHAELLKSLALVLKKPMAQLTPLRLLYSPPDTPPTLRPSPSGVSATLASPICRMTSCMRVLTSARLMAAARLGWQDAGSWERAGRTAACTLAWDELSDEQRGAAVQLGFSLDTWPRSAFWAEGEQGTHGCVVDRVEAVGPNKSVLARSAERN